MSNLVYLFQIPKMSGLGDLTYISQSYLLPDCLEGARFLVDGTRRKDYHDMPSYLFYI